MVRRCFHLYCRGMNPQPRMNMLLNERMACFATCIPHLCPPVGISGSANMHWDIWCSPSFCYHFFFLCVMYPVAFKLVFLAKMLSNGFYSVCICQRTSLTIGACCTLYLPSFFLDTIKLYFLIKMNGLPYVRETLKSRPRFFEKTLLIMRFGAS